MTEIAKKVAEDMRKEFTVYLELGNTKCRCIASHEEIAKIIDSAGVAELVKQRDAYLLLLSEVVAEWRAPTLVILAMEDRVASVNAGAT